jgi:hypothetical protein
MAKVTKLHQRWMKNKEYRKAHEELAPEFALARAVIDARVTRALPRSSSRIVWTQLNPSLQGWKAGAHVHLRRRFSASLLRLGPACRSASNPPVRIRNYEHSNEAQTRKRHGVTI